MVIVGMILKVLGNYFNIILTSSFKCLSASTAIFYRICVRKYSGRERDGVVTSISVREMQNAMLGCCGGQGTTSGSLHPSSTTKAVELGRDGCMKHGF